VGDIFKIKKGRFSYEKPEKSHTSEYTGTHAIDAKVGTGELAQSANTNTQRETHNQQEE